MEPENTIVKPFTRINLGGIFFILYTERKEKFNFSFINLFFLYL